MKFKFLSVLISCLMILSACGNLVSAINPEICNDGTIVVNNPMVKDIQNAINNAQNGDTILINGSVENNGTIICNKNLTVIGDNDCTFNKVRWKQKDNDIQFKNIKFENNQIYTYESGNNGGAIQAIKVDLVSVINCTFINNECPYSVFNNDCGGAIYSKTLVVNNSFFSYNHANYNGGAIVSKEESKVINSLFVKNNCYGSESYSVIESELPIDTINYVNFSPGGAIYSDEGSVESYNSTFTGNFAHDCGGAIYAKKSVISTSLFKNNTACTDDGGAVWSKDNVIVNNSIFENNLAQDNEGGAIYVDDYGVTIIDSSFINNSADVSGGAVWANKAVSVGGCSFVNNSANGASVSQCEGGAIYSDGDGVKIIGSNFTNNYAYDYGGAVWSDDGVTVESSRFVSNSVTDNRGGAIYMDDSYDLRVSDSAFYGNHTNDKVVQSTVKVILHMFT